MVLQNYFKRRIEVQLNDTNLAFVRIAISHWGKSGFPIDDRADILGTLYSTGLFKRDETIRIPNKNPKPNEFGKNVEILIKLFQNWN